jgi:hypothetical protein
VRAIDRAVGKWHAKRRQQKANRQPAGKQHKEVVEAREERRREGEGANANADAMLMNFSRLFIKNGEHTWGMSNKVLGNPKKEPHR